MRLWDEMSLEESFMITLLLTWKVLVLICQWMSGKAEEIPNLRAIQYLLAHHFPRVAIF